MKLHRFTATTNQKAIAQIHAMFGPDALIYSTRSVDNGIEILAGPPYEEDECFVENINPSSGSKAVDKNISNIDYSLIEKLNLQLQTIQDRVEKLSKHITTHIDENETIDDEHALKRNLLSYHLSKLGFRGKFCQQFIHNYLRSKKMSESINEANIKFSLFKYIKTFDQELIDENTICALIGPTGIGKTTTITKLAKRHIVKFGAESLGIVTTDYTDISGKNQLLNFCRIFHIDLEFANDKEELELVLNSMKQKKLVLIDTHGISQRDTANVNQLLTLLESQGDKISSYLILPCNVQEPILDEIARSFTNKNLAGCIFTKQDECISTAPALSVSINYKMRIAYICNGQDIDDDIEKADAEKILYQIMNESLDKKRVVEENLFRNVERVTQKLANELRLG